MVERQTCSLSTRKESASAQMRPINQIDIVTYFEKNRTCILYVYISY